MGLRVILCYFHSAASPTCAGRSRVAGVGTVASLAAVAAGGAGGGGAARSSPATSRVTRVDVDPRLQSSLKNGEPVNASNDARNGCCFRAWVTRSSVVVWASGAPGAAGSRHGGASSRCLATKRRA